MNQFAAKPYTQKIHRIDCRNNIIELGKRTLVMGILNVTPDSFSDGGQYNDVEHAVNRALEMERQGADIIDIGGESTRPGYVQISDDEEIERIVPAIKAVRSATKLPISIDTYKSKVAKAALDAGADMINDIWGLKYDSDMAKIVAEYKAPVIVMHNRENMNYSDFVQDVVSDLQESIQIARNAGIAENQIIVDPGLGFAKTLEQNLFLMNHLSKIVDLDYPVLLGTSRKSMIWKTLDLPVDQVLGGTIATVVMGIVQGCHIMRVHDVEEMVKACRMTDAMLQSEI